MPRQIPHDVLQLTLRIDQGQAGIESSGQDPLSRAWRVLLEEGRPVEATSLCLFADNAALRNPRWLGMLVLSSADRIIFFPGLSFRPEWIRTGTQAITEERIFVPEHLTLERNRRDWHFTSTGSEAHQAAGRARPLGEGFISWFGMTLASADSLAVLKQETQVRAAIPSSDVDRRYGQLRPLAEHQPQHLVTLDQRAETPYVSIHFAFLVGPIGAPEFVGRDLNLPFGSPFLETPLTDLRNLPARCHRVPLGQQYAIHIVAAALPVRLTVPVTFTTGR